jgi:hypothetical protein
MRAAVRKPRPGRPKVFLPLSISCLSAHGSLIVATNASWIFKSFPARAFCDQHLRFLDPIERDPRSTRIQWELGRFTKDRIVVLERLREELRKRGYVTIVFNFDKSETKDFTETVRLLASLSKFVIADITNPKSSPLELQATVPEIIVPFQPIIEKGEKPFDMLKDLQRKHDWVFKTLRYSSLDRLFNTMDEEIIKPAEAKFKQLLARRAEPIEDREV